MKRKLKRYKVSPDESLGLAFSVVNSPAVESDFQYFSEQKLEKFVGVEGERRMIYGCALRPSFPIYRRTEDEEYYLEFDKEAIDKISKNYFKMGFQSNWTEAHKDEVEGLTITESWIKEDMQADKSIALGLDPSLPIGSWFIGCYCENDDIWNKVKSDQYHGFSIEAIVGVQDFEQQLEELNTNNNMDNTNEEMFLDKLRNVLKEFFTSKKEEPAEIEPTNIELEAEPQAEPQPTVEAPKVEEPKADEPKVEEPVVEEPKQQEEPKQEEAPKAEEPKDNHLEELINNLKDEIAALKEMNTGLQEKIKDLGSQPSANPVNVNAKPNGTVNDASGINSSTYASWRKQMAQMIG